MGRMGLENGASAGLWEGVGQPGNHKDTMARRHEGERPGNREGTMAQRAEGEGSARARMALAAGYRRNGRK